LSGPIGGSFAQALEERTQRQRRRRLIRWGVIAGIVLVLGFLVWLVTLSPVFRVHDVTVLGNELVSADDIRFAAMVVPDSRMITVDLDGIEARVVELPAVRGVEVSRDLPDTVVIDVTERTVIFQRVESGTFQWVDEHGVIFSTSNEPVEGVLQAVTAGKDSRVLKDVAEVVSHIPSELLPQVERVQAKAVDRITLEMEEGDLVVWGSAEQSALKADVLAALLSVDAKLYDVSAPSHPTTK